MTNLNRAAIGTNSDNESKRLLLGAGIEAMKARGGYIPPSDSDKIPETEQSFSERTRSQRKTRDIRTKQWIQYNNRFSVTDNPTLLSFDDMKQIEFITFKKYLFFEPMDDFLEAIEKETESFPWLDKTNEGEE